MLLALSTLCGTWATWSATEPAPNEVAAIMREKATQTVRGNHDKVCSGIESPATFNDTAREAAMWTRDHLTPETSEWLHALPAGPIRVPDADVSLAHGSPMHEDIYILNIRDAWAPLQAMQQQTTFFGHTHIQGGFGLAGRQMV